MINNLGKRIVVGWASHEILWVEAALTLRGSEKFEALKDIAGMSGRSYAAVIAKASDIKFERESRHIENCLKAKNLCLTTVPVNGTRPRTDQPLEPPFIRPLSKAELMQGRAA